MNDRAAPPGWYRDIAAVNTQRYWDGAQWTEQVQPLETDPAGHVSSGILRAALIIGAILVTLWMLWRMVSY